MLTLPAHAHVIALRFCLLPKDEFLLFCDLVEGARGLDKAMKPGEGERWRYAAARRPRARASSTCCASSRRRSRT